MTVTQELYDLGVQVRSKSESRLMRTIGWVLGLLGISFTERFWTTISGKIIWAPTTANLDNLEGYAVTLRHEMTHIRQARDYPVWFQLSYLLLPLPFLFAYGRWHWERQAYLVDIRAGRPVEDIVQSLWRNYLFTWPKPWMRAWFAKRGLR